MKMIHQTSMILTITALLMLVSCQQEENNSASIWKTLSKMPHVSKLERIKDYVNDCETFGQKLNKNIQNHDNETTLRFMSYNVHFWRDPHDENNITSVFALIQKINPDILCLQEVIWHEKNKQELTQTFEKLGYKYGGDTTFVAGKGALGNIVFSKYPLSDLYSKKYKNPVRQEYRSFTGGTLTFNNEPIRFYCTHLDVWDETGNARVEEITELTDHIKNNDADIKNVIFMGDFNAIRKEDYNYTVNNKNVWELLVENDKKRNVNTTTEALDLVKKLGYQDTYTLINKKPIFTVWSGKIVDFVFIKPGGNLILKNSQVYYSSVSDHLPVITDFKVKKIASKL